MGNPYTKEYYESLREGARSSAEAIVPLVVGLLHPRSVIDVGCGDGTWLSVFLRHGVRQVLGIDRDYVSRESLAIPEENFLAHDLRAPLVMDRSFDLVVSLEVAEHLPQESAETFVDSLARLGPVILFSAATPFQGGTDHLNERWPEYWAGLFDRKGFAALDPIRKRVWARDDVELWYRQNTLLFVRRKELEARPELEAEGKDAGGPLSMVHPEMFLSMARSHSDALRKLEVVLADADKRREEGEAHRAKAERSFGEVVELKAELAGHRAKAEGFFLEMEALKAELAGHRAKAEGFFLEMEALKAELAGHRAKAEHYIAESERYRGEAASAREEEKARRERADCLFAEMLELREKARPENMPLGALLKALPAILAGAFRRAAARRSKR